VDAAPLPRRERLHASIPNSVPDHTAPLVSVITPSFVATEAQGRLLDETLATVAAQDGPPVEVLVIDDGSPIDIAHVVTRHPRTRLLRQPNAGPAVARNLGIGESRGDYLVFLDADDHLLPDALAAGLRAFADAPTSVMVVGRRADMTHDGQPTGYVSELPPTGKALYLTLLDFDWYIIPPSSCMVRREVAQAIGGFRDPWGADDLDFYLRVARHGAVHCYGGAPVTRYRRYATSSSRDGARMLRSVRAVYEREWPFVGGDAAREAAFRLGLARLTDIFQRALIENVEVRLADGDWDGALAAARLLAHERPELARETLGPALAGAVRLHVAAVPEASP
jgi:glycosyltransferase involved in cell wall biosynthesis